jgi:Uma2 family endonuclease
MSQPRKVQILSEEEYLATEESAAVRHEYVDGQIFAMAGAGKRHNRIVTNLAFHLRGPARGGPCGVYVNDMKLRLEWRKSFYYPDVMLGCERDDSHDLYLERPCLVAEVLSPSTETVDKREKLNAYQSMPSLRYILLVSSSSADATYYVRNAADEWEIARLEENEVLLVECGGYRAALSLEDIYEDVVFP